MSHFIYVIETTDNVYEVYFFVTLNREKPSKNVVHSHRSGFFKFIKITFLSQLTTTDTTYWQCLCTLCYVDEEEVKAEINCCLSSNRENDVATAQLLFTSPFPPPYCACL